MSVASKSLVAFLVVFSTGAAYEKYEENCGLSSMGASLRESRGDKALIYEVTFDKKAGYALFEELCLAGKIVSIRPGDVPLPCYLSNCRLKTNKTKGTV